MKLELRRALVHFLVGILIVALSMQFRIVWELFFVLVFGIIVSIASKSYNIPVISWFVEKFERPEYRKKFPGKGLLFLVAGCLLSLKLFSNDFAFASILILSIGDPVSHLFAGNFKGKLLKRKSLSGFLFGTILSAMAASIFVPFIYALAASAAALAAEVLVIKLGEDPVDDNIIIPLVAGTVLYLLI